MATLTVTQTTDFRGGAAETNITEILFQTPGPGKATATFEAAQFGAGLISDTVAMTGDTFQNQITVELGSAGSFSATGWTFDNWSSNDAVSIEGTSGDEIITGSSEFDSIHGDGGIDHIDSGAGNDLILLFNGELVSATTIEGGTQDAGGFDQLVLVAVGTTDFSGNAITGVEQLTYIADGQNAILGGDQIGTGGFTQFSPSASRTVRLTVRGDSVDLTGVTFVNWGADETITIEGTSATANTLTGSSQADIISGTGSSTDTITGGDGADALSGFAGSDTLNGGAGADAMTGGLGDDTYVVDNAGDTTTETGSSGTDVVQSTISFTLSAEVENLVLNGTAAINGTGNGGANALTGNSGNNTLSGLGADDTLTAFGGADRLDGGTGADTLIGGNGDDTYVVDNGADTASEASGSGVDLVQSTVSFTLAGGIENLVLNGTAAINGTGNGSANALTGTSAANVLSGLSAGDTLTGFGGADRLDGGTGADTLIGGNGDDTYVVENAGDTADESSGTGIDVVQSTVSFTLAGGVENLVLNGTAAINGTGNGSANTISGNGAANRLDGNAGADTMTGFGGADVFVFDDGDGADTVTDFTNGSDTCDLTAVAAVDEFSDLAVIDNGATVTVNYGTGSFTIANIGNPAVIDSSDFVFA